VDKRGVFWKMLQAQATEQSDSEKTEKDAAVEEPTSRKDSKAEVAADVARLGPGQLLKWAWAESRPDAFRIFLAFCGSVLIGVEWPIMAIILARALDVVLGVSDVIRVVSWDGNGF
jgi:hypothetical protein